MPLVQQLEFGFEFWEAVGLMKNGSLGISSGELRRAAGIKEQIERLESDLEKLLSGRAVTRGVGRRGGARVMSAAGKAKIVAAQKKRWAKWRKEGAGR